jgi:predicted lipoprotein with Yx(FWY)xxD motif
MSQALISLIQTLNSRGPARRRLRRLPLLAGGALAGAAALAACGSSYSTPKASPAASQSPAAASYTVTTANVGGLGTVLVNGSGRTLYLLDSEAGGKLTCTDANGCTKVWPDTELPHGVAHGASTGSAHSSLLGTVRADDGSLYLTYGAHRWPLYTFSGDAGAGQAHGQGIHSFGGTWWAISPAGDPIMANVTPPSSTTPPGSPTTSGSPASTVAPTPAARQPASTTPPSTPPTNPPATTTPPTSPPATTTPPTSPPATTTPCTIPQNNGGDHDADNNGGPDDGDGCDV